MRVPAAVQAPALVQLSRYEAGVVDESEYRRNEGVERPRTTVRCQKRHARQLVVSIKYILLAGFRISGQYDSLLLAMALGLEETRVSSAELFPHGHVPGHDIVRGEQRGSDVRCPGHAGAAPG